MQENLFQAALIWVQFSSKEIVAGKQRIDLRRVRFRCIYTQHRFPLPVHFDMKCAYPVRTPIFGLAQHIKGLLRLLWCIQAHEHLLAAAHQLVDVPLLDEVALLENGHAIAYLLHLVQQVTGEKDGLSKRGQAMDQLADFKHACRVKPVGWLV